MCKRWSHSEVSFLQDNYGILYVKDISSALGRTERSVITKANRLGLKGKTKKDNGHKSHTNWLKDSKYKMLEDYILSNVPILHKHLECGHEWKVSPNNLRKLAGCPNCSKKNYSKKAINWIKSFNNPNILHAENGGEQLVENYFVDGYDPITKTVYEFHGNVWHGNPRIFYPDDKPHPFNNLTAEYLFSKTEEKSQKLVKAGYTVIEIWEDEWEQS